MFGCKTPRTFKLWPSCGLHKGAPHKWLSNIDKVMATIIDTLLHIVSYMYMRFVKVFFLGISVGCRAEKPTQRKRRPASALARLIVSSR